MSGAASARSAVAHSLGAALAAKASDALCVALARPRDEPIRALVLFADDGPPDEPLPRETPARRSALARHDAAFARSAAAVAHELRRGHPALALQPCWLSRTLHVAVGGELLATVAADDDVERIELAPRIRVEQTPGLVSVTLAAAIAAAERLHLTGAGVDVGLIDSEVRRDHRALLGRVVRARNFTTEPFGTPALHGTAMAGIIAASADEFRGFAPEATIHNYKVVAPALGLPVATPDLAIEQALEDHMAVVNCSWGAGPATDGSSPAARACDRAWAMGMTIVKSSGDENTFTTPGDADGVIVVGGTDMAGTKLARDSASGVAHGSVRPHLVAPGGASTEFPRTTLPGGGIGSIKGGTSIAAAHVTGLVALALEREPDLTPDEVRDRLVAACVLLADTPAERQGAGIVDAAAFLRDARS
jgi:serine protease AprX